MYVPHSFSQSGRKSGTHSSILSYTQPYSQQHSQQPSFGSHHRGYSSNWQQPAQTQTGYGTGSTSSTRSTSQASIRYTDCGYRNSAEPWDRVLQTLQKQSQRKRLSAAKSVRIWTSTPLLISEQPQLVHQVATHIWPNLPYQAGDYFWSIRRHAQDSKLDRQPWHSLPLGTPYIYALRLSIDAQHPWMQQMKQAYPPYPSQYRR